MSSRATELVQRSKRTFFFFFNGRDSTLFQRVLELELGRPLGPSPVSAASLHQMWQLHRQTKPAYCHSAIFCSFLLIIRTFKHGLKAGLHVSYSLCFCNTLVMVLNVIKVNAESMNVPCILLFVPLFPPRWFAVFLTVLLSWRVIGLGHLLFCLLSSFMDPTSDRLVVICPVCHVADCQKYILFCILNSSSSYTKTLPTYFNTSYFKSVKIISFPNYNNNSSSINSNNN